MPQAPLQTPDRAHYRDVACLIRAHAAAAPGKTFLHAIEEGRALSFAGMHTLAGQFARYFADHGIGRGDRVLVLSENTLDQVALYFATLAYGASYCTINVEVNAAHIEEMIARVGPRLVVFDTPIEARSLPDGDFRRLSMTALFEAVRGLPAADAAAGVATGPVDPDTVAVISFTSGTSAAPKGVLHEFGNYFWIARQTIDMWKLGPADRVLEYRSFSWASSHMLTLMPCLVVGATVLFTRRFSKSGFFEWIDTHRPSVVIGVPTVVNMLLDRDGPPPGGGFDGVRFMSCSTAPLLVDQHRRFEETYGIELVQLYGMSEGGVVAGNHAGARRIGSVGPPGLYQNLAIVAPDGTGLPAGAVGEIEIGGAQNGYGYLHPGGRLERIRGRRLKTGDLGYLDEDGYLHVTGRAKDVIIRGGVNIAPLEIDNALVLHPDIVEAASIGTADPVYGEAVVSYVAPRPGAALREDSVRAHCAAVLPDFKRPRDIVICAEIPKNERGKIDRNVLRRDWDRRAGR